MTAADSERSGAGNGTARGAVTARATPAGSATVEPDAPTRILQAATELLADRGVARFNLQEVAEAAGVSKGLIHYHYHDRDTLLARLIESVVAGIAERERAALDGAAPAHAVDALWTWLRGELRRGHLRVLLELVHEPGPLVRAASHAAAAQRRAAAADTVERLFTLLQLQPRVPPPLLADVVIAFEDGLAMQATLTPEQDPRIAFDVFWLAALGLAV